MKNSFNRNFAKWVNGDIRALFITGLSGAGKTTTGQELADLMDAKLISLDGYLRPLIRNKIGIDPDYEKVFFEQGVQLLLEDNPEGKLVIEGCHIGWFNLEELKEHAVLYIPTSFVTSSWRALCRSFSKKNLTERGVWGFWDPVMFNLAQRKHMGNFCNRLAQLK